MNPVLGHQAGKLVLEVVGLALGAGVIVLGTRRLTPLGTRRLTRRRPASAQVAAVAIAAFALVCGLGHLGSDRTALGDDRRIEVGARAGTDYCFLEDGAQAEIPFINWVRARLPRHAIYQLDDIAPEPDGWCLTLALLPALPAGPGHPAAQWEIAYGGIPAGLTARIARGEDSVRVYSSRFALAKGVSP